jgi:hypothetical protein
MRRCAAFSDIASSVVNPLQTSWRMRNRERGRNPNGELLSCNL